MKSGFVNIFGKPNAGKSTLLNALMGEKLAIVSHKVQTTRHRIKGILTGADYQIIFSDTPGIIHAEYRLQEKMMDAVKNAISDTDLGLLIMDGRDDPEENDRIFSGLNLKAPALVVLNKVDLLKPGQAEERLEFFKSRKYCREVMTISALKKQNTDALLVKIIACLPEGAPFFEGDDMSDLPVKFFAGELIREQIFKLFEEEIPYHTTVVVQEYQEKDTLTKIRAEIVVQRETQKVILLGQRGSMIKKLGSAARVEIEAFIGRKVFLELFIKVRPKWRDNELHLREYGY